MKKIGGDNNINLNELILEDDPNNNDKEVSEMDIKARVFYHPFENSKRSKVSDFRIMYDNKKLPYLSIDVIDNYLKNEKSDLDCKQSINFYTIYLRIFSRFY